MAWLLTGGAGYIGSHISRAFLDVGIQPVILDNLNTGRTEFVPEGAILEVGDIADPDAVRRAYMAAGEPVEGVVHLAALKAAGDSVHEVAEYYRINVEGTRILFETLIDEGLRNFVFSSSAAVFGTPDVDLVDEDTATAPESPYGESKLIGEWLLADFARMLALREPSEQLSHVSLRYFNVCGVGDQAIYDVSKTNLFPRVIDAARAGVPAQIFGTDYPTPDGTCIRDYIHVADVAEAHVKAAQALSAGREVPTKVNLGRGAGVSVREIIEAFQSEVGEPKEVVEGPRRAGDPPRIVTSAALAESALGWKATRDLPEMVRSQWESGPR